MTEPAATQPADVIAILPHDLDTLGQVRRVVHDVIAGYGHADDRREEVRALNLNLHDQVEGAVQTWEGLGAPSASWGLSTVYGMVYIRTAYAIRHASDFEVIRDDRGDFVHVEYLPKEDVPPGTRI